jgi:hypothetical protein
MREEPGEYIIKEGGKDRYAIRCHQRVSILYLQFERLRCNNQISYHNLRKVRLSSTVRYLTLQLLQGIIAEVGR